MACKNLVAVVSVLIGVLYQTQAAAVTAPYEESFETEPTCSASCTSVCTLSATGWVNDTTDTRDWIVDVGGTTSGSTGPSTDHTLGTTAGKYLYIETSSPCDGAMGITNLISPPLDLVGLTGPAATFWYHMYGVDTGAIHVDVLDGSMAVLALDAIPVVSGDQGDIWIESANIDLTPYLGNGSVHVRIRHVHSGLGFEGDSAIDDFSFKDATADDVGVSAIVTPATGCGLNTEAVSVTLQNFSGVDQTGFDVEYSVDGNPAVVETFTGNLPAFGTAPFTFSTVTDVAAAGPHDIVVTTVLGTDVDSSNDGQTSVFYNGAIVVPPAVNTFESPDAAFDWTVGGTNPSWALGTPADTVINTPYSGTKSWVTNLTLNYNVNEESYVQTTCGYDFSAMTSPAVRAAIWIEVYDGTSGDGVILQSSTDFGSSWNTVGGFQTGINWYNDNANAAAPAGSLNAWSGDGTLGTQGWVVATHDIGSLAGESNVLFRVLLKSGTSLTDEGFALDDFEIFDNTAAVLNLTGIPGESPPVLGAIPPRAAPVNMGGVIVEALGPATHNLTTLTVTNTGNVGDQFMDWHLYLDDGDGIFDLANDTLLDSQAQAAGVATFNMANLGLPPITRSVLFVGAEVLAGAMPGTTFGLSIDSPSSDIVFDTAPTINVSNGPLASLTFTVGELVSSFPFSDDFSVIDPAFREVVGPGAYPAAASVFDPPALGIFYDLEGRVQLIPELAGLLPVAGTNFLALDFPNDAAAAAVQYAFDLSSFNAASDPIWFFIRYTDDAETADNEDGVFISLDGGGTWDLMLLEFTWTDPVLTWVEQTLDISQALNNAGLDYTDNVVIRVQGQGIDGIDTSIKDGVLVDQIAVGPAPKLQVQHPAPTVIADGGSEMLGDVPGGVSTTLSYELHNVGGFPMQIISIQLLQVSGFSIIAPTDPAHFRLDAGDVETLSIDITPNMGPFSFIVSVNVQDPSLSDGIYNFTVSGNGVVPQPEIDVERVAGKSIANGATDDLGPIVFGESQTVTYVVQNEGLAELEVSDVALEVGNNVTASITADDTGVIAPGGAASVTVTYTVTKKAPFSFAVVVDSDDADENPYVVIVNGAGTESMGEGGASSSSGAGGGGAPTDEGCSCAVVGRRSSSQWWLVSLLVGVAAAERRRRRARGCVDRTS